LGGRLGSPLEVELPLGPLQESESLPCRWWRTAKAVVMTALGFSSLLFINLLQTLSLSLLPFSRRAFRRFNRWCANTWWGWCVVASQRFNKSRVIVTGDNVPDRENAIIVANHQQMPDITIIMAFARSKGRLGDLKWFVKRALGRVPGVGWGMKFINCPFVDRDWSADRDTIRRTFSKIVGERIPLWLINFSEGTRVTLAKIARSQEYARSVGARPLDHVLFPRTKGFVASVEGLRHHIDTVYDLTIGYVDGVPTLWQYVRGQVREAHLHVRRFAVEELPEHAEDLSRWLVERFEEKDRLLAHFYEYGVFPEGPLPAPVLSE
jgi:lysocardiolipin and lysophospholipid acyltransferase